MLAIGFKSPILFVSVSLLVGIFNFLDSMLFYFMSSHYPFGLYLKPIFFTAQVISLLMFLGSVRFKRKPLVSNPTTLHFLSVQAVLTAMIILFYLDLQVSELAHLNAVVPILQLAINLVYLVSLSGTSFWFSLKLLNQNRFRWFSVVFALLGLSFVSVFLAAMMFWIQNYSNLSYPTQLALFSTYSPHVLMFIGAMTTVIILFRQELDKKSPILLRLSLLAFVPAFLLPLIWDGYKEGIINSVIRDVVSLGMGYTSQQWYAVSFYLMSFVAYMITLRTVSKRSDQKLAFSLIIWGVASFPWNGIFLLRAGYSSIPANVISMSAIITGASQLKSWSG